MNFIFLNNKRERQLAHCVHLSVWDSPIFKSWLLSKCETWTFFIINSQLTWLTMNENQSSGHSSVIHYLENYHDNSQPTSRVCSCFKGHNRTCQDNNQHPQCAKNALNTSCEWAALIKDESPWYVTEEPEISVGWSHSNVRSHNCNGSRILSLCCCCMASSLLCCSFMAV